MTPRPKTLTPSPPMSRAGSSTGIGTILGGVGQEEEEQEGDLPVLLRTIDFAARVRQPSVQTRLRIRLM